MADEINKEDAKQKEKKFTGKKVKSFFSDNTHKNALIIFAIAFLVFLLSFAVKYIFTSVVMPSISTSQAEVTDFKFVWGRTEKSIEGDITVWKQATAANKVSKISSKADYVRLNTVIPAGSEAFTFKYVTSFCPSMVELNGATVYDNGFGAKKVVGNMYNSVNVESSASDQSVDIYIYAPLSWSFKAISEPQVSPSAFSVDNIGVLFSAAMVLLGLAFFVITFAITLKNKNLVKLVFLSATLFFGGGALMMGQLSLHSSALNYPVFYNLQIVLYILSAAMIIVSAYISSGYKTKVNQVLIGIFIAVAMIILIVIQNPLVIAIITIVYSVIIALLMAYLIMLMSEKALNKSKYYKLLTIMITYITIVNIYNLVTLVFGKTMFSQFIPAFGIVIYSISAFVIFFKQSVNQSIMLVERDNQVEENSVWFNRIANMLSDIITTSSNSQFAIRSSEIIVDIIKRNEMLSQNVVTDEEAEEVVNIKSSAAIRQENGEFAEILNNGNVGECNYASIASLYDGNAESKIRYAMTYLDLLLVKNEEVMIILHFENFTNGLSELFKNIVATAHTNMETVYQNYNLRNDIELVQENSIISLAEAVEYKGRGDKVHLYAVSEVTKELCKEIGFSENETRIISSAAIVHDIGKIAIADDILYREGPLSDEDREVIKKHVVYGYNILSKSPGDFMNAAAVIAYQHHEKYDGSGYLGISGDNIHIYARIVAVADVFDALISPRVYKKSWTPEKVRDYIDKASGTEFDPTVVEAFDKCFDKLIEADNYAHKKYS